MEGKEKNQDLYNLSVPYLEGVTKKIDEKNEKAGRVIDVREFIKEVSPERGPYSMEEIKKDNERLEIIKKKIEDDSPDLKISKMEKLKHLASAFESSMPFIVEESGLFGNGATSFLTTEFDDVMNGIDVVIDFEGINNYTFGLAVDLTISEKSVEKKIKRIKENLNTGVLSHIKYFKTRDSRYIGRQNHVVPLIITASSETAVRLVKSVVSEEKSDLEKDVFQFQVIDQAIIQLKEFYEFTSENEKKFSDEVIKKEGIAKFIKEDLNKMELIINNKIEKVGTEEYNRIKEMYDASYYKLIEDLNKIFNK